jgi:hypothetical protein
MMVATEILQHPQDELTGVLNIPTRFEIVSETLAETIPRVEASRPHE